MGRGRAKAKQTRKARELKYSSPGLDADALQRELAGFSRHDQEPDEYSNEYAYGSAVDDEDDEDNYRR
ncbi:MAG TPA: DUF3073 domain-containing protein [Pseudonocardia sp.]|jgi:hypothetical protein